MSHYPLLCYCFMRIITHFPRIFTIFFLLHLRIGFPDFPLTFNCGCGSIYNVPSFWKTQPYRNYGTATSGTEGQFLKLEGQKLHIDIADYQITQCDKILGILSSMVSQKA